MYSFGIKNYPKKFHVISRFSAIYQKSKLSQNLEMLGKNKIFHFMNLS